MYQQAFASNGVWYPPPPVHAPASPVDGALEMRQPAAPGRPEDAAPALQKGPVAGAAAQQGGPVEEEGPVAAASDGLQAKSESAV